MLIKACGSLSAKNLHAKESELYNSKDLFVVAVTKGKLVIGHKNLLQFA